MMKTTTCLGLLSALVVTSESARADVDLSVQASHMLVAMEGDAHHVATLLRQARAARAPGAAKCVDGFLSQIDASVRHGRDDLAAIRSATSTGDADSARRAMGWLASRREAARTAAFAADACASPLEVTSRDHTIVHVIVDTKLPSDPAVFTR
jgi:hypothetical protein